MPLRKFMIEAQSHDGKHITCQVHADSTGQAVKKARPIIAARLDTEQYTITSVEPV